MAEAVIGSIAEEIVALLASQAMEKVGKLWGIEHELEALGNTIYTLRAVLDDAGEQYYKNHQVKVWLENLKDAFYEAQDLLEEFNIEAMRRELRGPNEMMKKVSTLFSSSKRLALKWKMSSKVRAVRGRIEAIKADKGFQLDERPVGLEVERARRNRRERHSFIPKEDVIGRDDDKKAVREFLLDSDVKEDVSILPIVGIGGLGKTALAKSVFDDEMVSKQFNLKMWVCVSDDFDVIKIVKKIIACAKEQKPTDDEMELLQSKMRAEIDGRKYILVLDDLWDIDQETWLSLKTLLVGGARGSKILITTRFRLVAEITGSTPPHFLEGLSESASLDLLMQMAGRKIEEIQDSDMVAIGKEIVRKCSGVPLIVRTVGSLLFLKKTKSEWLNFKDYKLPQVAQREDHIISVLKLSYDHLPSHLKRCFALCSLFPKDYEIKLQTLTDLWLAEGFIQLLDGSQHLEDIAHGYFIDLLWSNFFQDYQKDKETCKMHDLMHDLACSVAETECCGAWDGTKFIHERTRHTSYASTFNLMGELPISILNASALRTILSIYLGMGQREAALHQTIPSAIRYSRMGQRDPRSEAALRQIIQSFKRLRILDLQYKNIEKVPRSICELKHLTYLNLSNNKILKRLPNSITRLQNLQTLNLSGCINLEELPRDIRKLVSLRNLDIDDCWELSYVPCGLGQLISLHRLTRFILPKKKALAKNYCRLRELNGLNNIRGSLCIENLGSVIDAVAESRATNLMEKYSLESLALKWGYFNTDDAVIGDRDQALLDGLRLHSNLQKLMIDKYQGESFPRWMMSLCNLVELHLQQCERCNHLPPLDRLPDLKSLKIWGLTELEYIESDHSLSTSFPSLLKLDIGYCEKLKAMPPTPHLEELRLWKSNLALINQIFSINKLKSLSISKMEFLECLPEEGLKSLTSLESLEIKYCPRLNFLSLGMQHLWNLVDLTIWDCEELDLSKDESSNILDFQGLQSLCSVNIRGLPKLASLPQWLLRASNLERLEISDCSNLEAIPEQIEALQSLQLLRIIECPSLTSLPEGMQRLASLTFLRIAYCPDLEERCKRDAGEDWNKIAHIPEVIIGVYSLS